MSALLLLFASLFSCSDPVYYPNIDREFSGVDDTAVGPLVLEDIPCSPDAVGADDNFNISNRSNRDFYASLRLADCQLSPVWTVIPGDYVVPGHVDEVWVITEVDGVTPVAWTVIEPGNGDALVVD